MDSRRKFIGVGDRGTELVHWVLNCPNVDFAAFVDIYTKRLIDALELRLRLGHGRIDETRRALESIAP